MPKAKPAASAASETSLAEDLIEALQDVRVVEAVGKALAPLITLSVEEGLKKQLEGVTSAIRELKTENTRLRGQCEGLAKENARLSKSADEHRKRLDDMDAYTRSDNLIIRGLPERTAAERASAAPALDDATSSLKEGSGSVETTVLAFCNDVLGVKLESRDISIAHRLKAAKNDRVRPVIVRFVNRKTRNAVYGARKLLKNSNEPIFISEHLSKAASDLFYDARKMLKEKKIHGTWTQNGQVHVKFSSDPNVRASVIKCSADLTLRP